MIGPLKITLDPNACLEDIDSMIAFLIDWAKESSYEFEHKHRNILIVNSDKRISDD